MAKPRPPLKCDSINVAIDQKAGCHFLHFLIFSHDLSIWKFGLASILMLGDELDLALKHLSGLFFIY